MTESSDSQPISEKLQRIGDYRVIAELARGGMGRVYLARRSGQAGFERLFAIKVMHDRLLDDAEARLMLLDEAHIASRLHHPNVVSVLDVGRYADGHYLVMDYVEGCTLKQLLDRTPGYRPARIIIPIMLDALRGLHAAHTLRNAHDEPFQVVHRDVSPDNLLVGLDGCCRVTDFGVAKSRERLTDTQVGVCKGKIAFMAPEQLRDGTVDLRVDVWAAGVTLYAALTGEHPFKARTDGSILHSILHDDVLAPSTVGMRPPAELDAVILRALARDPEQRFADAQTFAEALREVAIATDLLGTSKEVAEWVETASGYRLAQRRRMIAELSQHEHQASMDMDGASSEPVPREHEPSSTEPAPSLAPVRARRPQRSTSAAVVLTAMLIGGVLGWTAEDEARADTRTSCAAAPVQEVPRVPAAVRKISAISPVRVLNAEPGLADLPVHPAQAVTPHARPHHEPLVGSARAVDDDAASEPSEPTPALESAQPAMMMMDRNPYLHGR